MAIRIGSAEDAIVVLPHMMGFTPTESLVVMGVEPGVPTGRVDLPRDQDELTDAVEALRAMLDQHAVGKQVIVMAFSADEHRPTQAVEAMVASAHQVAIVADGLVVMGDDWHRPGSAERGTITPERRAWAAAEFAFEGRPVNVLEDRSALVESLRGDTRLVGAILRVPGHVASIGAVLDTWALGRVEQYEANRLRVSDHDVARLVLAIQAADVRDLVTAALTRDNAAAMVDLWEDVVRRTPDEWVSEPAAQLALSAWVRGDGAKAWAAVGVGDETSLKAIVDQLLTAAIPPTSWEALRPAFEARAGGETTPRPELPKPPAPNYEVPPPAPDAGPGLGL